MIIQEHQTHMESLTLDGKPYFFICSIAGYHVLIDPVEINSNPPAFGGEAFKGGDNFGVRTCFAGGRNSDVTEHQLIIFDMVPFSDGHTLIPFPQEDVDRFVAFMADRGTPISLEAK